MEKYPMTPPGLKKLEAELKKLKEVDRPANVKAIEEAREHGDISENAEFEAAKQQQSLIASRIEFVGDRISRAEVIDPSTLSGDKVVFGATVVLENLDTGEEVTYQLVGEDEADTDSGRLSIASPIARGLIRKEVGDEVAVKAPGGVRKFEVVDVLFQ